MSTTISEHDRRNVAIALGNKDAAKVLCDAVVVAADAVGAADEFLITPLGDLDAGDDLADIPFTSFDLPVTLLSIKLLAYGAFAGVDASNTIVVTVKDSDGHTIVTKTYNNSTVPTDNGANALGTLDATHKILAANEAATISIACGLTADPPDMAIQIRFRYS